jgi:hypothetical protein
LAGKASQALHGHLLQTRAVSVAFPSAVTTPSQLAQRNDSRSVWFTLGAVTQAQGPLAPLLGCSAVTRVQRSAPVQRRYSGAVQYSVVVTRTPRPW